MTYRYEFVGGTSRKFWEINEPYVVPHAQTGPEWIVEIRYGRIGTEGRPHTRVFWSQSGALNYYTAKTNEKLREGYQRRTYAPSAWTSPRPRYATPTPAVAHVVPKDCDHAALSKRGPTKWACVKCGALVEFEKPTAAHPIPIEPERVRRFINLRRTA